MTKRTLIKYTRRFTAADAYIIGFIYKRNLYMITIEEIPPRFIRVERESSKKGGRRKLQLRLNNQYKEQLIRKGAVYMGDETVLDGKYNKGVEFEKLVSEFYGITFRGKDNIGFWVAGDINVNGTEYQIKLDGAQIAVETTLEKLKKRAS